MGSTFTTTTTTTHRKQLAPPAAAIMGKIVFYEDRKFGGQRYECTSDCADLRAVLGRCRSIRVESGMFVIYDRPGYAGGQYFMRRGEYSDYMNHCVRSCRMIPAIIFYEDKNFSGRFIECSNDSADLTCLLKRCNSIRVESGCFMIYEKVNYTGNQYCLRRGEYCDHQQWRAADDAVCSCRLIQMMPGSFNMRLYQRLEFGGQMMDLADDCPSVMDRFHVNDIFSCNVTDGNWLFYEQRDYLGPMYLIRPGDYKRFSEWGGRSARVGSIRRILDY